MQDDISWRLVIDHLEEALAILDETGVIFQTNQAADQLFKEMGQVIEPGRTNYFKVIPPDTVPLARQNFTTALEGNIVTREARVPRNNAGLLFVIISYRLIDSPGSADRFILLKAVNVTKQKEAQYQLRKQTDYLSSVVNSGALYMIRTDLEGRYTFVNQTFSDRFKYAHLIGQPFRDTVHPNDVEKCNLAAQECIMNPGRVVPVSIRKPVAEGGFLWTDWEFSCVNDEDGLPQEIQAVGRDVTDEKIAQQALASSQANFTSIINNTETGYVLYSVDRQVLDYNEQANEHAQQFLGFSITKGEDGFARFPHRRRVILEEYFDAALQGRKTNYEISYPSRQSEPVWFLGSMFPVLSKDAGIIGVALSLVDITQRKKVELELRLSESKLRAFFRGTSEVSILIGLSGEIVAINDKGTSFLAIMSGKVPVQGSNFFDYFCNELSSDFRARFAHAFEGPVDVREEELFDSGGLGHWWRVSISAAQDDTGQVVGTVFSAKDIHARKQAESALRESESRFRNLADAIPVMIWVRNAAKDPVYFNKTYLQFSGRTLEEQSRVSAFIDLHPDNKPDLKDYIAQWHRQLPYSNIIRLRNRFGEYRWLLSSSVPRVTESGVFDGYIGSLTDITDQKTLTDELSQKQFELQKMVFEKDQLIKEIHHRVKNNLQVMMAVLFLKSSTLKDQDSRQLLFDIRQRLRAIALIHERLIRQNPLEKVSVLAYIQGLIEEIKQVYRLDPMHIQIEVGVEDIALSLDSLTNLGFVVNELMTNSIKHAFKNEPFGLIRILFERFQSDNYRLVVEDNGCGFMDPDILQNPNFFGIQLIKIFAEHLHGVVRFESTPGKGTICEITF